VKNLVIVLFLISLATLLAEKQRREEKRAEQEKAQVAAAQALRVRMDAVITALRADFHPKQEKAFTSKAKRKAVKCTRRAGKTRGGCRETMARSLEARTRVLYCAATRKEAKDRAWRSDTKDGWRDLIDVVGLVVATTRAAFDKGQGDVLVNETELTIDFRNGSQLAIFAADRPEDADKLRGGQKDIVWVDEAQIFPALQYFIDQVVEAMVARPAGLDRGEVWLSGTPERNLDGLFFEVTKEPDQGERLAGWEVHEFAVIDNPYFGDTAEARWEATAGETLRTRGWDPKNPPPEFIREWLGKWTSGDAFFVFLVHLYPPDEFAPSRVNEETGAYDHVRALRDLPEHVTNAHGTIERIVWYFVLGVDFGGSPDPFAWVLWAFSPQIEDIYEMGSWKKTDLTSDDMKGHLWTLWNTVGQALVGMRGDSSGALGKPTLQAWQEGMGMPIEAADRHGKAAVIQLFNGEIAARRVHYRKDSMLLVEHKNLQWKVMKPTATDEGKRVEWKTRTIRDPKTGRMWMPSNHCSDSSLYGYRDLITRRVDFDPPPLTEEERNKIQEQKFLASIRREPEPDDVYGFEEEY
jgi:hypothetical protein